ncbi:LysE family translocator [Pseudoalteromonas xiamenensis]
MIDIIFYAFGVMYTPGPVNAIGLNNGIQNQPSIIRFFVGVGAAMFILFFGFAIVGESLMNEGIIKLASVLGAIYVLWLSYKVFNANIALKQECENRVLTFRDGLLMQLLNPKAMVVVLPVATIQFPAAGISGIEIILWCIGLAIFAFGAPFSYFLFGRLLGNSLKSEVALNIINKLMAFFLFIVAISMATNPFL